MTAKRILTYLVVAAVLSLWLAPVFGAMTYDQNYYRNNRAYLGSGGGSDPLYNLWGTLEGLYEGTTYFDAIQLLESTGATYYTKIAAGNQSANLTLTLPTAYAGVTGYVLSSTDAGVLSWVANGGTFTGGNVTSDMVLNADGVDILADTTTAHTFAIQARDIDGAAYVDILRMTNGDTAAMVLGAATVQFSLASTGLDISTAGAISNATTIQASGAVTASGGITLQNAATITNSTSSEIALTSTSEDLVFDMDSASNVVGLKSSTGVNGLAMGDVDDLSGVGGITFDAAAATITTATTDTAQDLTLSVTGATNSSLVLVSSGTAADALTISTSAGGMDITVAGAAAAEDLDITANSSVNISSTEAAADDSIVISALGAASGIDITSLGDIDITTTGAAGEDIQITNTGGSIMITATEGIADAIKIAATGTAASATVMDLTTTDGGITIAASGAANGDLAISGADDASLTATDDLTLNGGSAGSIINIGTNTQGNVIHIGDNDTTADSIAIGSAKDTPVTLSGLAVTVGSTGTTSATTIQSGTGDLALTSTDDISLTTNTTTTDNITITNTPGTAADAVKIVATAGGLTIDAAAAKILDMAGGTVQIDSKTAGAGAIALTANQGTADTITVINTQGTGAGALTLTATAGGVDIDAAAALDASIAGGQVALVSKDNAASAISLTANVGASETIVVTNTQGTGEGAITLTSTAGGIDLNAAALKDVDINAGQVKLTGVDNVAGAIALLTNTGTSETITVTNTVGTGAGAITLTSTAGGMTVNGGSGADISITSTGKSVNVTATEAASDAIALTASTGAGGVTITGGTGGVNVKSTAAAGAVVAGTCTAVEYEVNGHHRTVLSLLGGATFDLEDKDDGNGIKIYDFPEGNVIVLGAFMDAVVTSAATVTTSYVMSVGTAIAADAGATLTGTEADFVASCTVTCGAGNEDAHGVSALTAAGLVMVPFDGTGGGKDIYLNAAVAAGDISATSAIAAVSGTITIEWIYLGDF